MATLSGLYYTLAWHQKFTLKIYHTNYSC